MFPVNVTRTISFSARVCLPVEVSLKERTGAQIHSDGTLPKCLKFSLMECFVLPSQLGDFKVLHKKDFTHTKQRDYWVSYIVELLLIVQQTSFTDNVSKTGPFELIRWCVISKHHILGCQRQAKSVSFPSNGVEQCMREVFTALFPCILGKKTREVTKWPEI